MDSSNSDLSFDLNNQQNVTTTDLQSQTATHLSAIELGLGSFLHAFKIPFAGHLLSLNQGFFLSTTTRILSRSTDENQFKLAKITFEISILTAILKSLSPAGQKWGPMLSISMQGILFSLGVFLFGAGFFGAMIGMILLSLWAFIQPFITLLVSLGFSELQKVITFYVDRLEKDYSITRENMIAVISTIVIVKIIAAVILTFLAFKLKTKKIKSYQQKLMSTQNLKLKTTNTDVNKSIHILVLKDLTRPLFLISFLLTYVFLFITEENTVSLIWKSLRPLGIAILIFYVLRSTYSKKFILKLVSKSNYLKSLYLKSQKVFDQLG